MKHRFFAVITALCLAAGLASGALAAQKTIYIKPFAIVQGFPKNDHVGNMVKDYVSEYIIERGGYSIISDDEVKQVMAQEEIRMALDTCYDDACIKKLLESIRTDYMIYGTVAVVDAKYVITIKMLDRTSGTVRLARVKTLEFKNKNKMKMAAKDLAAYVVAGRKVDMSAYEEEDESGNTAVKVKTSSSVALAYNFFTPFTSPFNEYYDGLHGLSATYSYNFGEYIALLAGTGFLYAKDNNTGNAAVSINPYYAGIRLGTSVLNILYPYAGVMGKGLWYFEKGTADSAHYLGYGVEGFVGLNVTIWKSWGATVEYSASWARLNDGAGTDISGGTLRIGGLYSF